MTKLDLNEISEITKSSKHKTLLLRVIQYFGTLLMTITLILSETNGKIFGADITIDQGITIPLIPVGTGLMFWAYYRRKQIEGNRTA